jgi:hypothetical protein
MMKTTTQQDESTEESVNNPEGGIEDLEINPERMSVP